MHQPRPEQPSPPGRPDSSARITPSCAEQGIARASRNVAMIRSRLRLQRARDHRGHRVAAEAQHHRE